MRFSAIAALCAAPLAMASVLQAEVLPRDGHKAVEVVKGANTHVVSTTTIIIVWVNVGGGAATEQVSPTQQAPAATHTVTVGGPGGLVYSPEELKAAVGDMVIFTFLSQNHTVSQSPFDTPCKKLADGLDSGFLPNPNNTVVPAPQFAVQVTSEKPLWFYCRQKAHCGKGMVFSINPTAEKTHAQFKQLAIAQNGTGEVAPIAGGSPAASSAAPAATTVASAAPVASSTAPADGLASGVGSIGTDGSCSCSCLCGVDSFPNPAVQGRGMISGWGGSIPMAKLEKN